MQWIFWLLITHTINSPPLLSVLTTHNRPTLVAAAEVRRALMKHILLFCGPLIPIINRFRSLTNQRHQVLTNHLSDGYNAPNRRFPKYLATDRSCRY
jgi:hypothetical protein